MVESESGPDFQEFFETHYRRLAKALFLLTGDPVESDELAQEVLVRAFERWDQVRVMDSPVGYLYQTALNLNRSRLRRLASRARHAWSVSEATEPDPLTGVEIRHDGGAESAPPSPFRT